jgi:hypothetical protein
MHGCLVAAAVRARESRLRSEPQALPGGAPGESPLAAQLKAQVAQSSCGRPPSE